MLTFLVKTLLDIYIMVLLLRIWMQWAHCDFYNTFSECIVKMTPSVIRPLRRVIPALDPFFLLAFILAMVKFPLLMLIEIRVLILDLIYLLVGMLVLLKAAGKLVFWMIIIRSSLSVVSQRRSSINLVLYQLSEPLMHPIRRLLPSMTAIDYSPIIILFILCVLNYLGMVFFIGTWHTL